MSGLVLKLGPHERILVNGAVIENGGRRSRLNILTPNANILRLRDAIHPKDANTPVRRVCYILQLILSGETDIKDAKVQAIHGIEGLKNVFTDSKSKDLLDGAENHIFEAKIYLALKAVRNLIPRESLIISGVKK